MQQMNIWCFHVKKYMIQFVETTNKLVISLSDGYWVDLKYDTTMIRLTATKHITLMRKS